MASANKFIQSAVARMKAKGTVGAFGKATPAKVAAGKAAGGTQEKRAIFADNMRTIAQRTQPRTSRRSGGR